MITAAITSVILFIVVIANKTFLIGQNRPLTASDALLGGFSRSSAFGVETGTIIREHNV
jgi:hypothetical protein